MHITNNQTFDENSDIIVIVICDSLTFAKRISRINDFELPEFNYLWKKLDVNVILLKIGSNNQECLKIVSLLLNQLSDIDGEKIDNFNCIIKKAILRYNEESDVKIDMKKSLSIIRIILTNCPTGPPIQDVIRVIGKNETIKRLSCICSCNMNDESQKSVNFSKPTPTSLGHFNSDNAVKKNSENVDFSGSKNWNFHNLNLETKQNYSVILFKNNPEKSVIKDLNDAKKWIGSDSRFDNMTNHEEYFYKLGCVMENHFSLLK
ncbi:hypothetical protein A3Q56_03625 [Intoshia linei]|uniref:Aminoacyl-tRNA synthetase class I anticodon-binding domain-containing protein n=1 Tax=Intoshia linei TaxID=1819745 RepID=A0A177B4I7_9BILA|nr:hypothetical protein A3Q56_03625 [Intoshia linei]